jgi:hypothetical protein
MIPIHQYPVIIVLLKKLGNIKITGNKFAQLSSMNASAITFLSHKAKCVEGQGDARRRAGKKHKWSDAVRKY